jgi:hypothetical protein
VIDDLRAGRRPEDPEPTNIVKNVAGEVVYRFPGKLIAPRWLRRTCSAHAQKPLTTRETDVPHPVHTPRANLEAARLSAVEALAATKGAVPIDALRELAVIQAAGSQPSSKMML